MNLAELNVTKQALRKQLAEYERITPCCHSCEHFATDWCSKYEAKPPPEWKNNPVDCVDWVYDLIPF